MKVKIFPHKIHGEKPKNPLFELCEKRIDKLFTFLGIFTIAVVICAEISVMLSVTVRSIHV